MLKEFSDIVNQMPTLFQELQKSELLSRSELSKLPKEGVYVLFESSKPIYVERSNRLRQRIQEHSRPSSTHNSAPFAFNLAKEKALLQGINCSLSRDLLAKESDFKTLFSEAKQKVYNMQIRVIHINDQVIQTIFKVYASLALKTPYNDFTTH